MKALMILEASRQYSLKHLEVGWTVSGVCLRVLVLWESSLQWKGPGWQEQRQYAVELGGPLLGTAISSQVEIH